MRSFLLIAQREYVQRVHSRAFLLMTIFIPALMFGVAVVPTLLATRYTGGTKHLVVAAEDPAIAQSIKAQLEKQPSESEPAEGTGSSSRQSSRGAPMVVDIDTNVSPAERNALTEKVRLKQIDGVIWADRDAVSTRKMDLITREVSDFTNNLLIQGRVSSAIRRGALISKGLNEHDIEAALKPVDMTPRSPFGAGAPNGETAFLAVFLMVMVLYMST